MGTIGFGQSTAKEAHAEPGGTHLYHLVTLRELGSLPRRTCRLRAFLAPLWAWVGGGGGGGLDEAGLRGEEQ